MKRKNISKGIEDHVLARVNALAQILPFDAAQWRIERVPPDPRFAELRSAAKQIDPARADRILSDALDRLQDAKERKELSDALEALKSAPAHALPRLTEPPITREQVMKDLRVSHTYLNWIDHTGDLVPTKVGARVMYERADVDAFFAMLKSPSARQAFNRRLDKWKKENRARIDKNKKKKKK